MTLGKKVAIAAALLLIASALAAAAAYNHKHRVVQRALFLVTAWQMADEWRPRSLWLSDYRVRVDRKEVAGISDLSALTYNPQRNSLFTVNNRDPELVELSLDGEILRRIPLLGFDDPEAVEYIGNDSYVISDERHHRLHKVRVRADTRSISAADSKQLSIGIGRNGNYGFEGLAWDPDGYRLFVAKEKPVRIYEVRGFPKNNPDQEADFAIDISDDKKRDQHLFVRDLSSLQYDRQTGHLLALSDESRLVIELDIDGQPISTLSLKRGQHGLGADVPQPEGIAMDDSGRLYLVSEPNLFYVFEKEAAQGVTN